MNTIPFILPVLFERSYFNVAVVYRDDDDNNNGDAMTMLTMLITPVRNNDINNSIEGHSEEEAGVDWPMWGEFIGDRWIARTKCQ